MREDRRKRLGPGVRQVVSTALILTAILFFLPALVVRGDPVYQRPDAVELPDGESPPPAEPAPSAGPAGARGIVFEKST